MNIKQITTCSAEMYAVYKVDGAERRERIVAFALTDADEGMIVPLAFDEVVGVHVYNAPHESQNFDHYEIRGEKDE